MGLTQDGRNNNIQLCFEILAHSELIVPGFPTTDTIRKVSHLSKRSDFLKPLECYSDQKSRKSFLVSFAVSKVLLPLCILNIFSFKWPRFFWSVQSEKSVIFPNKCQSTWLQLFLHKCIWFSHIFLPLHFSLYSK